MRATAIALAAGLAGGVLSAAPAGAAGPPDNWAERVEAARQYAAGRPGFVSFAVVDEKGRFAGGSHADNQVSTASVVKSMLLVAYLRRRGVRDRELVTWERRTLRPMIRKSRDDPASAIFAIVGQQGLRRLADRAGMSHFATSSRWGLTQITARDISRYFYAIDDLTPPRHRRYVLSLLGSVVPIQQWGVPPVTPPGFTWHVKGGWINGVVNQVALLTRGPRRLSLAVLIEGTPDTEAGVQHHPERSAGTKTIKGVAARLLHGYR